MSNQQQNIHNDTLHYQVKCDTAKKSGGRLFNSSAANVPLESFYHRYNHNNGHNNGQYDMVGHIDSHNHHVVDESHRPHVLGLVYLSSLVEVSTLHACEGYDRRMGIGE